MPQDVKKRTPLPASDLQCRDWLRPYVTSTTADVFALKNLPEVLKGALFSRYSRSTKGLRRLLHDEFILPAVGSPAPMANTPASDSSSLSSSSDSQVPASEGPAPTTSAGVEGEGFHAPRNLDVSRADAFYQRVLAEYGDDSIGELGGAHLALEKVSLLAAKLLQTPRIGGSPLEKSTRYVRFVAAHPEGYPEGHPEGYRAFYREPRLLKSAHAAAYLETMQLLFGTYRRLLPRLQEHLTRVLGPEPQAALAAQTWRRALKARVFDDLRGLLPAATLTNMGLFGNGRFFEHLLQRLRLDPLAESRKIARQAQVALNAVIPAFIQRAQPQHHRWADVRRHHRQTQRWIDQLVQQAEEEISVASEASSSGITVASPAAPSASSAASIGVPCALDSAVELYDHDATAEPKMLAALLFRHAGRSFADLQAWAQGLAPERRANLWRDLGDLRSQRREKLPRALELSSYSFALQADFGVFRDIQRHRMMTQERQLLGTALGFDLPPDLEESGLAAEYTTAIERAATAQQRVARDFPAEAQYMVPQACHVRWHLHGNLRALTWLIELRTTSQGHPGYRRLAQKMYRAIETVQPSLAQLMRFVQITDAELGRAHAERQAARKTSALRSDEEQLSLL